MKGKKKEGKEHLILEVYNDSTPTERDTEQGIWNEGYVSNSNNNANTANVQNGNPPPPSDGAGLAEPVGSSPRPSGAGAMPNPQPEITINDGEPVDESGEESSEDEDESFGIYKIFTPKSYERLLLQEAEERKRLEDAKNNMQEGRLVDGQLKFGNDDQDDEEKKDKDPWLANGMYLNESEYGSIPPHLCNKPIEEIDKYLKEQVGAASIEYYLYIYAFYFLFFRIFRCQRDCMINCCSH